MSCERVQRFIEALGYRVDIVGASELSALSGKDETWTDGALEFKPRRVLINNRIINNRRTFLFTLLHEAGHALARLHGRRSTEAEACEFGWRIKLILQIPGVTLTEWNEFNWEAFA